MKISPLKVDFPSLKDISGVQLSTFCSGTKYKKDDLLLVHFPKGAIMAGIYTQSHAPSSAVQACKHNQKRLHTDNRKAYGLIVNSGNANVFTGEAMEATHKKQSALAKLLSCQEDEIFVSSTGVIGEKLPVDQLISCYPQLYKELSSKFSWKKATKAIMTTDTFEKGVVRQFDLKGKKITLNGIAKGSGMIEPNMATMLAYFFTDAAISADLLQKALARANEKTFNCITVDSDTSTSDTVLIFATEKAENQRLEDENDPDYELFYQELESAMLELSQHVVRDGEGACKFIEIHISGAQSIEDAKKIGKSIANSPLVKTAISGEDANWGRIIMAAGKAGVDFDPKKVTISFGDYKIVENEKTIELYKEALVEDYLKNKEIYIHVGLNQGPHEVRIFTCDLTKGYIDINADYRS